MNTASNWQFSYVKDSMEMYWPIDITTYQRKQHNTYEITCRWLPNRKRFHLELGELILTSVETILVPDVLTKSRFTGQIRPTKTSGVLKIQFNLGGDKVAEALVTNKYVWTIFALNQEKYNTINEKKGGLK